MWTCGSPKGAQHDGPGFVCAVCASPRGVGVDRRRACPHRRDVGAWCTADANGVATFVWAQWFCEVVCGNRNRRVHNGYPRGSGRHGGMRVRLGRVTLCICVVAVVGLCDRRVGTAWRLAAVTHDDPDRRPNRSASTITGPSQNLRCWFGKGTPLIAAKPLSWVSPCLTSCCLCRGA